MVNYTSPATTAISDTRPAESDGKVWVDTSENPPKMKLYDSATGAFISASANATVVSQTEPTPEVGKIWFEPVQDGTNMYAASSGLWEFLKFLPAIPDIENLHAEYDAIKESAFAGDTLTSITDHSGGFGPLSGSATYQDAALNNAPAFVLDSSNNDILDSTSLNSNLSAPQTVYLVYRLDNTNSSANCIGFGRGNSSSAELAYRTRSGGNDRDSVQDTTSDGFGTSYSTDIQTPHISAFVLDSTAVIERDDKSAESFSDFTTGSYGAFSIGPDTLGDLWDGPISACLVYSAAHSQSTRDEVFSYLSPRFGF